MTEPTAQPMPTSPEDEAPSALSDLFFAQDGETALIEGLPTLTVSGAERHQLKKLNEAEFSEAVADMILSKHPKSCLVSEPFLNDNSVLGSLGKKLMNGNTNLRSVFEMSILASLMCTVASSTEYKYSEELSTAIDNYLEGRGGLAEVIRIMPEGRENYFFVATQAVMLCNLLAGTDLTVST